MPSGVEGIKLSDFVICTAFLSIAAVLIAKYAYSKTANYYHRRIMQDGNLQHAREATGPDPQVVLEMVLFGNKGFPANEDEAKA